MAGSIKINKYYERLYKLLNDKVSTKNRIQENYEKEIKEKIHRENEVIIQIKKIPVNELKNAFDWYADNELFNGGIDKSLMEDALSQFSTKDQKISFKQAELCIQILDEFTYKGDYQKRILDIKFTDLQKALDNSISLSSYEKRLLKQTIIKLSNNEYSQISYQEAKISVAIHDDNQFDMDNIEPEMSEYRMNSKVLEGPRVSNLELSRNILQKNLNLMISEIEDLLEFSKKLDDNFIVSYVDGHTDENENALFKRLIKIDEELEKEVDLLKKANSFFGRVGGEIEDNPKALEELIKFENDLKKNDLSLAKSNNQYQKFFDKIRDFITVKPSNFAFAAVVPVILGVGLLYSLESTVFRSNPAIIQVSELSNYNQRILSTISENQRTRNVKYFQTLKNEVKRFSCKKIKPTMDPNLFNKKFKIKVLNPNTKKEFFLENFSKVQAGNTIYFYFKHNQNGKLIIDHIFKENTNPLKKELTSPCEAKNLITVTYSTSKEVSLIGKQNGYLINAPLGIDEIIVSFKPFNKNSQKTLGVFKLQSIETKGHEYILNKRNWNFKKQHSSLSNKDIEKFHSDQFSQNLANKISWGSNKQKNGKYEEVYIDFNGDKKAEIIAYDKNKDGFYDYYLLDRNNNKITDAVVFPGNKNNKIVYDWLIDDNEDGKYDGYAEDLSGNWLIKKINDL